MRAIWLVPLLLCFVISSGNAQAPWCNFAGCKQCNSQNKCIACNKGWSFVEQTGNCGMCTTGCDKCSFTPINNQQWRSTCTGSCQNGCITCNSDYTCAKCPKETGLFKGQCMSCGESCSKCEIFQESWTGELILKKCIGYCGGGCTSCAGDGLTCNDCNMGYTLIDGKCWPCPTDCKKCGAGQGDLFYRGWSTTCLDAFQNATWMKDPEPAPEHPKATPIATNGTNYNNNNVQTSKEGNTEVSTPVRIFLIGGVVSLVIASLFFIKRNMKSKRANIQQDYAHAMAAEKQRQAALNIPTPNYQYQPPQGYPQGYQQGYNKLY